MYNWQSDFNYGLVYTLNSSAILNVPFNVERTSEYRILVRLFENKHGGTIRLHLDGELIADINTTSQLNRFIWKDLGVYQLNPGPHKIVLENVKGFNAINLLLLIPTDKYELYLNKFEKMLGNKIIAYVLEGESDLFNENGEVINNISASNGQILLLRPNGVAWQKFVVLKEGYYSEIPMVKTARAVCEVERAKPSKTVLVTNYNYVIIANGRYVDKTREGRYAKE